MTVGRKQAILTRVNDAWFIEDAGSPSGTYLDDQRVRGKTALEVGDPIDLSGLTVVIGAP